MSQGIGVRYSATGARILGLKRTDGDISVIGMAAGDPGQSLEAFMADNGFILDDAVVACGLCPGDFLSACVVPGECMEHIDTREQLRWEIERKLVSDPGDYFIDFAIADLGFVFAGRKKLIQTLRGSLDRLITDVELVALYNGCDAAGEIGAGSLLLVSAEAEGISSVLLDDGELKAMESFPVREEELATVLSTLDGHSMLNVDSSASEHIAGYVNESFTRITTIGDAAVTPGKIVIAGGCACLPGFADMIADKTGVPTSVSDPLSAVSDDLTSRFPDLSEKSAAFTTCFGLAVRALEE